MGKGKSVITNASDGAEGCRNNNVALPTSDNHQDNERNMHAELWHACAGPLVYVPKTGEKVFYFPQGHIEQIEPYANQDGTEMPIYNLPSKILCEVVSTHLMAEAGSDEVFAIITLIPVTKKDEKSTEDDGVSVSLPRRALARSFSKKLTASDTSTHGGFSIPKRHADECLPLLVVTDENIMNDMSQQPPMQKILAKDVHGSEWSFRHIYRGQPKRHLLTTGWSVFLSAKKLVAGDSFIFLSGDDGKFRVGIRRAIKQQSNTSTTVISASSMKHGILASAFHAISTETMFTVYYHPWTSPSEFVVSYDQYMKSAEIDYCIGAKFRMLFEGEDCAEQRIDRHEGTVIGIEDVDPIRWPNSEWRHLKVKWDTRADSFVRPEKVSPWNIELIEPVKKKRNSILHRSKRARASDASLPGFPSLVKNDLSHSPIEYATQSQSEVFQGQESSDTGVNGLGLFKPPLIIQPNSLLSPNPEWNHVPLGFKNQLHIPMHGPLYLCPGNAVSYPGENIASQGLSNDSSSTLKSYGMYENAAGSRIPSVPSVNSHSSRLQDKRSLDLNNATKAPLASKKGADTCKLFGVNLVSTPLELPSPQIATSSEHESFNRVLPSCQSSISGSSKSTSGINSEKKCKNFYLDANPRCTKVTKHGSDLGRSIDLTRFDNYVALIGELDRLFDFQGSLIDGSSGWRVTYIDYEEDMMLIGDYPWQEFLFMVRRMFICPREYVDKLNQQLTKSDASINHA